MIIGFVSDAHGNSRGLGRCLETLQRMGAGRTYFLGDGVGYLPDEDAVLELLETAGAVCLRGNHEEMLLGNLPLTAASDVVYRIGDARSRITTRWRTWIEDWPVQREVVEDGVRMLLVHGSPTDPTGGYLYPDTDLTALEHLPFDFVFCGHTHRPFVRSAGALACVNVGSCGLPRDVGNLASCAFLDTVSRHVEILRVEFDARALIAKHADRIHDSVASCLGRGASGSVVGRVIHA